MRARAQPIGWARLLKRVFDIDLRRCPSCGADKPVFVIVDSQDQAH